jgi:F0F1-type ATP synthase membrane subunit b/b'
MEAGAGDGTVMILFGCFLFALALFVYVFYQPGTVFHAPKKTRLSYLDERREAVYENLRDLSFEHKAGKLSDDDYEQQRQGLESEAAVILAEMESIQRGAVVAPAKPKKA